LKLSDSQEDRVIKIIKKLRKATIGMADPAVSQVAAAYGKDPFLILVSCLLSLRTKDTISLPVSLRLFQLAKTPQELLAIPLAKLEKLIHPVGFYHRKARQLKTMSADLIQRFDGQVPATEQELLSLPGVGRKTANLVLGEAFGIPALCVDTHVHRVSNRLGLVKTKTPEETEFALQKVIPKKNWIEFNPLIVIWGQRICAPISPFCSKCAIYDLCPRIGVKRQR
jgi:endonuclease-3